MELAEGTGEDEGHHQAAEGGDTDTGRRSGVEMAEADRQGVADGQVEEASEDVDGRGRQADARWRGEGALEGPPWDAGHEMRHGIGEEGTAE